jgi:hypothetical protein
VEIGKTKVYKVAKKLATLWLPRGWETAQARKDYSIEKCAQKDKLAPKSHANDAWAMVCWLYGEKPENITNEFYVWRRQEYSRRQLHLQNPTKGNIRKRYGGTTYFNSPLRKGDIIQYKDETIGYVGGWTYRDKAISFMGSNGKRIRRTSKVKLVARSPHVLAERRKASSFSP